MYLMKSAFVFAFVLLFLPATSHSITVKNLEDPNNPILWPIQAVWSILASPYHLAKGAVKTVDTLFQPPDIKLPKIGLPKLSWPKLGWPDIPELLGIETEKNIKPDAVPEKGSQGVPQSVQTDTEYQ